LSEELQAAACAVPPIAVVTTNAMATMLTNDRRRFRMV